MLCNNGSKEHTSATTAKWLVERNGCTTMVWHHVSARMMEDATMNPHEIIAMAMYMVWHEEWLWMSVYSKRTSFQS
jgi:hypothetical protein